MKVAPDFRPPDLWSRSGRHAWGDERRFSHTILVGFSVSMHGRGARKPVERPTTQLGCPVDSLGEPSTAPAAAARRGQR